MVLGGCVFSLWSALKMTSVRPHSEDRYHSSHAEMARLGVVADFVIETTLPSWYKPGRQKGIWRRLEEQAIALEVQSIWQGRATEEVIANHIFGLGNDTSKDPEYLETRLGPAKSVKKAQRFYIQVLLSKKSPYTYRAIKFADPHNEAYLSPDRAWRACKKVEMLEEAQRQRMADAQTYRDLARAFMYVSLYTPDCTCNRGMYRCDRSLLSSIMPPLFHLCFDHEFMYLCICVYPYIDKLLVVAVVVPLP